MTDDSHLSSGGKNSGRVDAVGSEDADLLRALRENPELRAKLREIVGTPPESRSTQSPPSPSQKRPSSTSAPRGLPVASRAPANSRAPSGLPSASRSNPGFSTLPDAARRDDLGPASLDPFAAPGVPKPGGSLDSNAPQRVPVPPRRSDAPAAEVVPSAIPTRREGKAAKKASVDQTPEAAPDLSGMAPLTKRSEADVSSLGSMFVQPRANAFVATSSSSDPFGALTTENSWDKSTPDAFLELLEKRNPQRAETASATQEVALLHDQSALERAANDAPMWLVSLFLHLILIIILAFLVVNVELKDLFQVVSEPGFSDEVVLDDVFDPDAAFETVEDVNFDSTDMPEVDSEVVEDVPDVSAFTEETAAPLTMTETALALDSAPVGDVENLLGSLNGDDLSGRGQNKAAALAAGGGTEGSEKSVALALAWLAEHQLPDGSWSYQLGHCPSCGGKCRNSGSNNSTIAATAMGVLPFLAAGNTPTTGKYKRVVAKGVDYLISQGSESENGMSFRDGPGNMYSHGLATITICETYAMLSPRERTRYRQLGYVAQEATRFIEYAQATDGGWRYTPKQLGDTSVSGWQMMALKSAELAGLDVYQPTILGMRSFLRDVVAIEDGARYCYMRGSSESLATDAIGLLCRLYLDWRVDNATLIKGAKRLAGEDRSLNNPYYIYYASQLLHNIGGSVWNKWNREMREKLINAQRMDGHERGSWFPENPDGHCLTGGRLYATSLNCMVLEVYYRHMPLYQKMEASEAFPLEGPGAVKDSESAPDEPDEDFPVEEFTADDAAE